MRLTSVRLTPDRLSACDALWGDRSFHTAAEFESTMQTAGALLASGRARGTLVVDEDGSARFFGMTLFATTSAVEQAIERPPVRLGASLLQDAGSGAILDVADIGRGNASGGLTLVVCAQGYAMEEATEEDWGLLVGTLVKDFHDIHRGFRLSRIVGQAFWAQGADIVVRSGAYPDVRLGVSVDRSGMEVVSAVFSITHQQAVTGCSPLLPMFTYFPPRVLFTTPEQEVLREALAGATDMQIATRLGTSVAAVKSRLTRAYERLHARLPGVLPLRDTNDVGRGSQVRHLVLDFVRDNPSELTPYERRRAEPPPPPAVSARVPPVPRFR
jgi:hypothetical protein